MHFLRKHFSFQSKFLHALKSCTQCECVRGPLLLGALVGIIGCANDPLPLPVQEVQIEEVKVGEKQIQYSSTPPILEGTWKTKVPDRAGNGRYSVREMSFKENTWDLKYTLADDNKMAKILFTYKAQGTFQLQNPSKRIPGVYLITYQFQKKTLQIATQDRKILKEFGFDSCKLTANQEANIDLTGCGIFPKISECKIDYDLVRQHQNKLEIGDRYAEFTNCSEDKRPVALGFTLEK